MSFWHRANETRPSPDLEPVGDVANILPQTQKEQRIAPLLPGLYPPPGTSPNSNYCNCGHAALVQVACIVIGAIAAGAAT